MTVRLAIDAASDRLSVAVERDGRGGPVESSLTGARRHAGALLGLVAEGLGQVGATPAEITQVAVADGPGSFTGLRVAFSAGKALAQDGATLWTAPSLLVRAVAAASDRPLRVLALSPALRGEAYAGAWRIDPAAGIDLLMRPRAIGPADLNGLPEVDLVVGEGPEALLAGLPRPVSAPGAPDARVLLRLMGVRGGACLIEHPATFQPDYGRPAEAQAKWEREHGRPLPDPAGPPR